MAEKLKIIPLGGLDEIGKNMTAYECGGEIIVVDCGMAFPGDDMYGIDLIIPDVTYLIKNRARIRGLFITHGHEDHIGALPYILKELNVPVYGTRLTIALIENKLREILETNIGILNIEAKDATIAREGDRFVYTDEVDGKTVDMEKALPALKEFLTKEWDYSEATVALATKVSEAKITRALCETIEKEPIGSYTTSFTSSSSNRCGNIENAVKLMKK